MTTTTARGVPELIRDHDRYVTVVVNRQFTDGQREMFEALMAEYPTAEAVIEDWSPTITKLRVFLYAAPLVTFLFDTERVFEVDGS